MTRQGHSGNKTPQRRFLVLSCFLMVFVTLLLVEIFYRVYLYQNELANERKGKIYRVFNTIYSVYDRRHGERFPPLRKVHGTFIDDGKVGGCWGTVSSSNVDGLGGQTTIAEYERAEFKILTFGDSWTHFYRDGHTIPDLVEDRLREDLGVDVANLNYGRGSYGVLQMLSLAADKIGELRPNLAIIQFITDDVTRARWWARNEVNEDGVGLSFLALDPDEENVARAISSFFIHPSATAEWCRANLGGSDVVTREIGELYDKLFEDRKKGFRRHYMNPMHLFSLGAVGLIPHRWFAAQSSGIPRLTTGDYADDGQFLDDVKRIQESGVPVLFIHIPTYDEIRRKGIVQPRVNTHPLLHSLREHMQLPVLSLIPLAQGKEVPADFMALPPYDSHPSLDFMRYLADLIARVVQIAPADMSGISTGGDKDGDHAR